MARNETITNEHSKKIHMDLVEYMSETVFDHGTDSKDMILEFEAEHSSTIVHATVTTVHAHLVIFALETDKRARKMNILILSHPYVIRPFWTRAVHNTPRLIANECPRRNKSRGA